MGGDDRIRTGDQDFADPCLATWPRRPDVERMLRHACRDVRLRGTARCPTSHTLHAAGRLAQAPCPSRMPRRAGYWMGQERARHRYCITPGRSRRLAASGERRSMAGAGAMKQTAWRRQSRKFGSEVVSCTEGADHRGLAVCAPLTAVSLSRCSSRDRPRVTPMLLAWRLRKRAGMPDYPEG
jgi:hypothetical protein